MISRIPIPLLPLLLLWAAAGQAAGSSAETKPVVRESIFTGAESGGQTTMYNFGKRAYALPLANLLDENRQAHTVGNSLFNENWVAAPASARARDGLGPLFHARSCSGCHALDGRGQPPEAGEIMTSLLIRLSIPGRTNYGGPLPDPVYGGQLAPRALPGLEPEAAVTITEEEVRGVFPDDTPYTLVRPVYRVDHWHYGQPHPELMMSPRVAPSVFGLGLLEAVPEERIGELADPEDKDGDGISGRMNRVWNPETKTTTLGRFGWKANTANLRVQSAAALADDMGLTTPLMAAENHTGSQKAAAIFPSGGDAPGVPELSGTMLDQLTLYMRTLAPPARRETFEHPVRDGQRLFHSIGCAVCHRGTLPTGDTPEILTELREQKIHPYTDLLLHDMGPELADGRPDYEASGSEWRTPPLWGIGLQKSVNGHERLLHDGRARNIEEAILWHGGEGLTSRDRYMALPRDSREKVLRFLRSL